MNKKQMQYIGFLLTWLGLGFYALFLKAPESVGVNILFPIFIGSTLSISTGIFTMIKSLELH